MRTLITKIGKQFGGMIATLIALLMCVSVDVMAQGNQITVRGKVTDSAGEPVIGAAVVQEGTTNGTVTDFDGNYTLKLPSQSNISCSFIGYLTSTLPVNGQTTINITLEDEFSEIEEVQVVAYGAQKKVTITGAISSVKSEDLVRTPISSVNNVLAGQLSGVTTVQYSGEPGADAAKIYVRGRSTFGGGDEPLIQVDGVERSMQDVDPNEIESVTVLKDASATAVFGVRGANGVILITTKRGQEGKANINVSTSFSALTPTKLIEMVSSATYAKFYNEMKGNDGNAPVFTQNVIDKFENPKTKDDRVRFPSIDWADYIMKDVSLQTQSNISVDGGTDKVKYFVSIGFFTQDGIFKQFDLPYNVDFRYKKLNYRSNIDIDVTKYTKMSVNVSGVIDRRYEPHQGQGSGGLIKTIYAAAPFKSSGIVDGKLIYPTSAADDNMDGLTLPASILSESADPMNYYRTGGFYRKENSTLNMDLVVDQSLDMLTKGLSFKLKGSYNTYWHLTKDVTGGAVAVYTPVVQAYRNAEGNFINPDTNEEVENPVYVDKDGNKVPLKYRKGGEDKIPSSYKHNTNRGRKWYFEASFNYHRSFGLNNVGALLLYTQEKNYYPSSYAQIPSTYVGYVARLTYDWNNRYMADFSFGCNGSENFRPGKRYGLFPGGSIGWAVSEEDFFEGLKPAVSFLKIRASLGLVGNDKSSGGRFMYVPDPYTVNYSEAQGESKGNDAGPNTYGYPFGASTNYQSPGPIGLCATNSKLELNNPDASWEKALKPDIGIDINFLDNRLSATFDYYHEKRWDILWKDGTAPNTLGFDQPYTNFGETKKWGWEGSLGWNSAIGEDWRIWAKFNISYNQNEIVVDRQAPQPNEYQYTRGKRMGKRSMYKFWRFSEGVTKDNELYQKQFGKALPTQINADIKPGDALFVDLDGNGKIDTNDMSRDYGFTDDPEYVAGLNLGATWKGLTLSMQWTGAWNVSRMLEATFRRPFTSQAGAEGGGLLQYHVDNTWNQADYDKGNTQDYEYPRATFVNVNQNYAASTLYEKDAKYLRLKTAEIAYNFNFPFMKTIGLRRMQLSLNGYNLITFTPYIWGDPEARASASPSYPLNRTYTASLRLAF